jgi:hypothetical protein
MDEGRRGRVTGVHAAFLICLLAATAADIASTVSDDTASHQAVACRGDSTGLVEVSVACVGPISLDSTLRSLRLRFPDAKEAAFYVEDPDRGAYAGLMFRLGGLEVLATQFRRVMAWDRPASAWMVTGSGALLPGRVPIASTWAELLRAYSGRVVLHDPELGIRVEFCAIPGLIINLRLEEPADSLVRAKRHVDDIPGTATVSGVLIDRRLRSACSKAH